MNKAQLQVINGLMNLNTIEKDEVLKFLNHLMKKSSHEQLHEEEILLENLIKLDSSKSICPLCGK